MYTLCRITADGHTRTDLICIPAESITWTMLKCAAMASMDGSEPRDANHWTNPLAIRIMNYGKYQDDAWTHLPSLGMHYVFLATPAPDQVAASRSGWPRPSPPAGASRRYRPGASVERR